MLPENENLSEAIQDYLKAIYEISPDGDPTSTNDIADRLNVAPASVTGMLKRLSTMTPPLVAYQKHHGVQLTPHGRQVSLQVLRQHRLIESFLVGILGYAWDEVHEEAERLEHVVSPRFSEGLAKLLGDPEFDPHGDPIPDRDLQVPPMVTIPLNKVSANKQVRVRRVSMGDAPLLRYLGEMGVHPGAEVTVLAQIPFDQTTHILIGADPQERALGIEIARRVQVELL